MADDKVVNSFLDDVLVCLRDICLWRQLWLKKRLQKAAERLLDVSSGLAERPPPRICRLL